MGIILKNLIVTFLSGSMMVSFGGRCGETRIMEECLTGERVAFIIGEKKNKSSNRSLYMFDAEIGLDRGEHLSISVKQPQGYVNLDISVDLKDRIHVDIGHKKKLWDIGCFRVIGGEIRGSVPIPPIETKSNVNVPSQEE